ncbi:MAG: MEDS domain-containing protein [Bacteroidetes bacterium]|nr:MEDS domain-containing protein [Bacteroidota bacterium]
MSAPHSEVDLGFTARKHSAGTHMCLIFQDEKERRKIISKFLEKGLLEHEKVAYFADVMTREEVIKWLQGCEIDITEAITASDLEIQDSITAYCSGGKFVPAVMLERLKTFYNDFVANGYKHGRVSGEMSWALKGIPGSERLMEYEAWVNEVFKTHPITAICQYDANKFSGTVIMDVLRVHPMMIVRGQIVHNPYYMTTEMFLKEFSTRD